MDQVLSECKRLGLSKDTIDRVRDWLIYTWQKQKTLGLPKAISLDFKFEYQFRINFD